MLTRLGRIPNDNLRQSKRLLWCPVSSRAYSKMHVLTLYERIFWPLKRKRLCIRELTWFVFGYSFYLWSSVFFFQAFSGGYETNNKSDKINIKPQTIGNSFYHILFQINIEGSVVRAISSVPRPAPPPLFHGL